MVSAGRGSPAAELLGDGLLQATGERAVEPVGDFHQRRLGWDTVRVVDRDRHLGNRAGGSRCSRALSAGWVDRLLSCRLPMSATAIAPYSNADDKPWQMLALMGNRIQT